jgi:hypothetical protein
VIPSRIICCGDSITAGFGPYQGGYRRFVMDAFRGVDFVGSVHLVSGESTYGRCEGYGGAVTTTIRNNTLATITALPAGQLPDVALWMTGTNDEGVGTQDPAVILAAALDVLAMPSVQRVLVSPPPPRRTDHGLYALNVGFRAQMDAFFAAPPPGIYYYDVGATLDDTCFVDATHPNNAVGYPRLGQGWLAALAAADVQPPSPMSLGYDALLSAGIWF